MRLTHVFATAVAAIVLAGTAQCSPAQASTANPSVLDIARELPAPSGGVRAAATYSATDAGDADTSKDITSTSLTFDREQIKVTVGFAQAPVIDEHHWLSVDLAFNRSNNIDGLVVWGQADATSPVELIALNQLGSECEVRSSQAGNNITFTLDAACFGRPGQISYMAIYGDFQGLLDGDDAAVDISPNDGWSTLVSEPGGYWLLGADGGIFSFGDAPFYGSTGNIRLNKPVVAMSSSPHGDGYRFVASDGGVFSYGQAPFFGSMGGKPLNKPVVGMATTATNNGYWLVASDGGIFAYGDAKFFGSMGGAPLNKPIVGMQPTSTGKGYWLVASDGGIFAFGDAKFLGSTGGMRLNLPITTMAATPDGNGYYLLASDGGVFAFGSSSFYGSGAGLIQGTAVAMAIDEHGGYRISDSVGGVYEFGSIYHFGDLVDMGVEPNQPVVGMAVHD